VDELDRLPHDGYWGLPASQIPALARHGVPELGSLSAIDDEAVRDRCRVLGKHDAVAVPTLHTAGWYDIFLQGTLDNFGAMVAAGREARLIAGAWTHVTFADPVGDQVFGLRAGRYGPPAHPHGDVNDVQLAWMRGHLGPESAPVAELSPVRIFVMGRNEWRDEPSWPLERAVEERWFLRADGTLTPDPPGVDEGLSTFEYDPREPVRTVGGATVMAADYPSGPRDQSQIEAREDVLVFTSKPVAEDLEVTGRIRVTLHTASSAPSTDWVARLCDVHPDGRSINICDGIVRVDSGADLAATWEVDLWSTSNVFLKGHRVRVQVTSSCFPRWDRNLNTGDQSGFGMTVAHQRVFHDGPRASFVALPIVR
jgi:putative CocE/NonD family hydrolase